MYSLTIKLSKILLLTFLTLFLSISCSNSQTLKCTRVVDGNTIVLNNGERVRLIGVDTPETKQPQKPVEYFGKEASAFTNRMVEGKEVRLEYDWQKRDKYNRLLAYVYLKDGTFINAEIVKQGYGHAYSKFPFKYLEQFRQYEKQARENKRGLWANKDPDKERYVGSKHSNKYHFPHCPSAQKIKPSNKRVFYSIKEAVDARYVPCKGCRPPYYRQ